MASKVSGLIEYIKPGGSSATSHALASTAYGYCTIAASEPNKTVDMTGFKLEDGVTIHVKFQYANTHTSPTLNVNSTGAKSITFGTVSADVDGGVIGWHAGDIVTFTYDKDTTSWVVNNSAYAARAGSILAGNIKPTIKREWVDPSYYGSSASDVHDNSTFFFMSVKPDEWYKPWTVRFKITTTCPAAANYYSVTYSTYSGRADSYVVFNWVERYDHAHYYTNIRTLKKAGFDAGLCHALGINLYASNNYANSSYYRKFELEYYDCDGCTVTIVDPIKWANWTNNSSTYYNGNSNSNAVDRGLQESGDNNTITRLYMGNNYFVNGSALRLPGYTIFGLDNENHTQTISLYHSTYDSNTISINTARVYNTSGFNWQKGLYYNTNGNYAVGADVNISIDIGTHAIDFRYTDNCVAAGNTTTLGLVRRKPVYLRGTIGNDGLFYLAPIQVTYNNATYKRAWTQDEPTEADNYVYWFLGYPYYNGSYASGYQLNFYPENKLYWYHNGKFQEYVPHAIAADSIPLSGISNADDLKAIEAVSGTGLLKRTGDNTWALDSTNYLSAYPNWSQIQQSGANSLANGSSDVTASTEILTSYASNNGFSDNNGKGIVYRRAASKVVNATLVKSALGTNSTHGDTFLRKDGTWQTPPYPVTSVNGSTGDITIDAASLNLSKAMRFIGVATVAITDGSTTDPVISGYTFGTNGASATAGDVVIDKDSAYEYVWSTTSKWERLGGDSSYKTTQTAFSNSTGTADGSNTSTTFIYSFSQTANGNIQDIKTRKLPEASSSTKGIVLLGAANGAATYGHNHDSTYLPLSGGIITGGGLEIKGHIAGDSSTTSGHGLYSGGMYNNAYNNIILHGDPSTGSSGIAFVSDKVAANGTITNINAPSDRAFIQYHACGVTTATAEGTAPTIATSGEAGRLVIGIGNDSGDKIILQAPGNTDIVHQQGATGYPIPHTTNTNGSVGGTTTPVYVDGGVIKAGTAIGASAYHADSYFALASHDHNRLTGQGRKTTAETIAFNPDVITGPRMSWLIYDSSSRTNDATNSPSFDASVINLPWDWGGYNGQIAISSTAGSNTRMQIRSAISVDNGENASPRYTPNYAVWREVVTATKATQMGSATQPVYISNTGQVTECTAYSSASVASATSATTATNLANAPSLAASGNNITVTAGGKTSSAFTVPYATTAGSVSSATNATNATNSTKIAAKLATDKKIFLLGTQTTITSTAQNVELTGDTGVYLYTEAGSLSAKKFKINDGAASPAEKVTLQWNSTDLSLDFVFT